MTRTKVEQWVTTREVAEHLAQTTAWVRHYAPLIPHVKMGKQYRFKLSEVDRWFEQWRGGESHE